MKGILFALPMIQAIKDGRKTQTRQLDNLKEINQAPDDYFFDGGIHFYHEDGKKIAIKPRYAVGETVYLKEAWWEDSGDIYYKADWPEYPPVAMVCDKGKWRSPLFMSASAARYFYRITAVSARRLQEITNEDCYAEGVSFRGDSTVKPRDAYRDLWDSIYGKVSSDDREFTLDDTSNRHFCKGQIGQYAWASNPWVWCYTIKKVEKPVEGVK